MCGRPSPDDAEGIATVHVKSWQEAYIGLLPQQVLDRQSVPARYRSWSGLLQQAVGRIAGSFVAIDPGAGIVGFVGATRGKPAMYRPIFEIPVIYILQSHASAGAGTAPDACLGAALTDQGRGRNRPVVAGQQPPARAFYEAIGGRLIVDPCRARTRWPDRPGRLPLAQRGGAGGATSQHADT